MKQEKYQQIERIFHAAAKLDPDARFAYLDDNCRDAAQRREVEMLLGSFDKRAGEKFAAGRAENGLYAGQRIKHYVIGEKLGAGGMGEVYLAQDTQLNRRVAIKFLLPALNADVKAKRRLLREARAVAALDHPNICTVYEVVESDERSYIVMQYIEGETLDARIKRQPLAFGESLEIVLQIAEALAEAHARGIIHRDIKPANVMINPRGQIKVLDFSLAKKIIPEGSDTTQSLLSQAGVIAGTIAYMSPEQARGLEIDARSDIWSLAVVLYEMLTGRLPFEADTKSDFIVEILRSEPVPLARYLQNLPPEIQAVMSKALRKSRDERYHSIHEFASELRHLEKRISEDKTVFDGRVIALRPLNRETGEIASAASDEFDFKKQSTNEINKFTGANRFRSSVAYAGSKSSVLKIGVAALLVAVVGGAVAAAAWFYLRPAKPKIMAFIPDARPNLQITPLFNVKRRPGGEAFGLSFSPDGNLLAFSLLGEGVCHIYVKQINGGEAIKITDGSWRDVTPVWSPDGQRVAFLSDREGARGIWAVSYMGGVPVLLRAADLPVGTELKKWSRDGRRIFYTTNYLLHAIDLESGAVEQLTDDQKLTQIALSADEEMIAFVQGEVEKEQLWVRPLRGGEARQITRNENRNWSPVWFADGEHLAYLSDQNGNFQIFVTDLQGGAPVPVTFGDIDSDFLTVSPDGAKIATLSDSDEANVFSYDLVTGRETAQTANTGMQIFPDVSPDGTKLSYQSIRVKSKVHSGDLNIKFFDDETKAFRLNARGGIAKWSPDGKKIAFVRPFGNRLNLLAVDVNSRNEIQISNKEVFTDRYFATPFYTAGNYFNWSPDGSRIAFAVKHDGIINLWTKNADGSGEQMLTQNRDEKLRIDSPVWSPQGDRIAHITRIPPMNSAEKWQYGVAVVEAGQSRPIYQGEKQIKLLGWSVTGGEIFIAAQDANVRTDINLLKITTDKNENPKQIARVSNANLYSFVLSNDGKQAAFAAAVDGADNLFVCSNETGTLRRLTVNPDPMLLYSGLNWSPDAKSLFYSKQTGGLRISMINTPK